MITVLPFESKHYPAVKEIYEKGIATGNATFGTSGSEYEAWDQAHLRHSRLVAEEKGVILGWAALSEVSDRCVYAGVAVVSIYVSPEHSGKGIGKLLLENLIHSSERNGIWTLQSGIFPENEASLRLHLSCGFPAYWPPGERW